MAENDVNYLSNNNTDCEIEVDGENQRAELVVSKFATGDSLDVVLQDQSTPAVLVKFNQVHNETTLSVAVLEDVDTITVSDPTGFAIGSYIIIFSDTNDRYYVGNATNVVGSVITLDRLLDSEYPIGATVSAAITNMAVDGSTTRQIFGVRSADLSGSINITVDITRIIFFCLCDSAVSLEKFANITALTRGLSLRKKNGVTSNIFNVKTNGEIDGITLDWKPYAATNPSQGQDGFTARLTFAGQDKMGIVQRLAPGEDLQLIVQDALNSGTPDITLLEVMAEGSVVLP